MHDSSKRIMDDFFDRYILGRENISILDLGSQVVDGNIQNSYRHIFEEKKIVGKYVGVDMVEGDNVDIVLKNPYDWKEIKSKSFDFVICGQVFEHVEFFWITLMEIRRVLKVGGKCCIIAPSSGHEHRYPFDCYRYYPDGMKAVAKYAGLKIKECYAEWNDDLYPLMDTEWRDCVLIAERKILDIKYDLANYIIKKVSSKRYLSKTQDVLENTYKSDFEIRKNILSFLNTKLYIDNGDGFNENIKISPKQMKIQERKFYLEYDIPKDCLNIRFDPVEGYKCILSNLSILKDNNVVDLKNHNGIYLEKLEYYFFETLDPQIIIVVDSNSLSGILRIEGNLNVII